jgi:hypothetical protein
METNSGAWPRMLGERQPASLGGRGLFALPVWGSGGGMLCSGWKCHRMVAPPSPGSLIHLVGIHGQSPLVAPRVLSPTRKSDILMENVL